MNAPVRDQWISMLESAARENPDAISSEWSWILERLKLPLEFFRMSWRQFNKGGGGRRITRKPT